MANSFQNELEKPELVMISELAQNIVYRVPGCADVMIRNFIRDVYREFCQETKCLTAEHRIMTFDKAVGVVAAFGGRIDAVRDVRLNGRALKNKRDYDFDGGCIYLFNLGYFSEKPMLSFKTVEVPRMNEEKTPYWFLEKHGSAIVSGVLSRLFSMQGRPWSDPQQAIDERTRYENFKSETRMMQEVPVDGDFIDNSQVL